MMLSDKCPFCGARAEILTHRFFNVSPTYGIKCTQCETQGYQFFDHAEDAIKAWNTRTYNTAQEG